LFSSRETWHLNVIRFSKNKPSNQTKSSHQLFKLNHLFCQKDIRFNSNSSFIIKFAFEIPWRIRK
jgi:hypothetical protein